MAHIRFSLTMDAMIEKDIDSSSSRDFDLTVRNGRICNNDGTFYADIGVRDGVIVALEPGLPAGKEDVDAQGLWVLPGGIDSHTHIEQLSGMGLMCADDFYSGTVSAAFGGTTTILSFAAQHRNDRIPDVLADYSRRAQEKAVIDYGFHLILTNPDQQALTVELPQAIRSGITSLKVYMTYDMLKLDDYQLLDVMAVASEHGAMIMLHAENHDMIRWVAKRLLERGHTAPTFHTVAHDVLAESEATHRAISLSRLLDVPILIVHVAGKETVNIIRHAQKLGAPVYAESCPQYLFLEASQTDVLGMEGAKFCCSPPPGDKASQEAIWEGFKDGSLMVYSSDHAPYRFDESGKLPKGEATTFKEMANGVPGIELRLPLLFSEGVMKGRLSVEEFVALTATNHAQMYGISPKKGRISLGADADVVLWDTEKRVTVSAEMLHDQVGYTPYEGRELQGWPVQVYSRGRCVIRDEQLQVERGSGQFIARHRPEPVLRHNQKTSGRRVFGELLGLKKFKGN